MCVAASQTPSMIRELLLPVGTDVSGRKRRVLLRWLRIVRDTGESSIVNSPEPYLSRCPRLHGLWVLRDT